MGQTECSRIIVALCFGKNFPPRFTLHRNLTGDVVGRPYPVKDGELLRHLGVLICQRVPLVVPDVVPDVAPVLENELPSPAIGTPSCTNVCSVCSGMPRERAADANCCSYGMLAKLCPCSRRRGRLADWRDPAG